MHFSSHNIDDLLRDTIEEIQRSGTWVNPTRDKNKEIRAALLQLYKPRSRISASETKGHIASCLGEFAWYMTGSDSLDFIEYYLPKYRENSDDGVKVWGAYGPRLLCWDGLNQFQNVKDRLSKKPETRKAIIQLFDKMDIVEPHNDVPCTTTLQFMLRGGKLDLFVSMRSNDVLKGLPHDIFTFTMIQEYMARSLGYKLGTYYHAAASLHLYESDFDKADRYLSEGWQMPHPMPAMPNQDPETCLVKFLDVEKRVRRFGQRCLSLSHLPEYWADLARVLLARRIRKDAHGSDTGTKRQLVRELEDLRAVMTSSAYKEYIFRAYKRTAAENRQRDLFMKQNDCFDSQKDSDET